MNKLFLMGAVFLGVLVSMAGYADQYAPQYGSAVGSEQCPPDQACGDTATGDCWCRYVHYEPCYYTTQRCVEERVPCTKTCTRYVPKYYQVQRCRYVPQYYCETYCKQEPECYQVEDCKIVQKTVCDQHCRYVPRYYWKHICGDNSGCTRPCPQQPACPPNCQ